MQGRFLFCFAGFFSDVKHEPKDSRQQARTSDHNDFHKASLLCLDTTVYAQGEKV